MDGKVRQRSFFFYALLSMAGNHGLVVAQDLFGFYPAFALMSFASYGLIVHYRSEEAMRAGRVTIILVVMGEILVFTALVLIHRAAGPSLAEAASGSLTAGWTLPLILAGFGIKAGAIPLHVWLPLAHPAAPTPASAVLSGAMIKAGLLGWLRFLPLGFTALPQWGGVFIGLGLFAAFAAVALGLTQRNPKTALAYSSISQMGLMTVGVGLALMLPEHSRQAVAAVVVGACHHGLSKGALFLGAGLAGSMPRRGLRRAGLLVGLSLPALSLCGLPLTGGFLAKGLLKDVAVLAPEPWHTLLDVTLPWTAWGTALLMLHFLTLASKASGPAGIGFRRLTAWISAAAAAFLVVWMLPEGAPWRVHAMEPAQWWAALWPPAAAVLTAASFAILRQVTGRELKVSIPPGDILEGLRFAVKPSKFLLKKIRRAETVLDVGLSVCITDALHQKCKPLTGGLEGIRLRRFEYTLHRFTVAGTWVVFVLVTFLLLLH